MFLSFSICSFLIFLALGSSFFFFLGIHVRPRFYPPFRFLSSSRCVHATVLTTYLAPGDHHLSVSAIQRLPRPHPCGCEDRQDRQSQPQQRDGRSLAFHRVSSTWSAHVLPLHLSLSFARLPVRFCLCSGAQHDVHVTYESSRNDGHEAAAAQPWSSGCDSSTGPVPLWGKWPGGRCRQTARCVHGAQRKGSPSRLSGSKRRP